MESWFFLVRLDNQWLYRWYVNNDYGQPIAMSCRNFWTKQEAEADLRVFLGMLELVR
jgi:hypothetical protein